MKPIIKKQQTIELLNMINNEKYYENHFSYQLQGWRR